MSIKGNAENYEKLRGSLSLPEAIQGKSAYEIAVMHGFDGTEEEWLASLHGTDGSDAVTDQTYKPTSTNAQSGKAVAEAVKGKMDKFGDVIDSGTDVIVDNPNGRLIFGAKQGEGVTFLADDIRLSASHGQGTPIYEVATPDGTDPTQSVNVEYVKKAREMRLICKKTVTAEDATYFIYSEDAEKKPLNLDEMYMFVNIPSGTNQCNMAVYLNGVLDGAHTFSYLQYSSGAGTYWVHAEKIADGRWKTLRAAQHATPSSRPVYASYDLEPINYINTIRLNSFAAGITFEIWGRDAI